jgi:hypothetical protein
MQITQGKTFGRNRMLKTGQTTQYNGMLDDGYYQKGDAKRYSVLTADQYAGTTNVTLNAKTDVKSNNCVLDLNTGLMWSRYVSASVGPDGKLPWTTNANGEGIFTYCAAANAAGLAGYSDWRVPNLSESLSIFNSNTDLPNATSFPSWPQIGCLTSSTGSISILIWSKSADRRWDGGIPRTETGYCSLVRGG